MLKKIMVFVMCLVSLFSFVAIGMAGNFASESLVLPKNVWRVRSYYQYGSTKEKFNSNGDKVELVPDIPYQNPLSPLAPVLGASHVYGTITGDGKVTVSALAFSFEYGFTDKLTGQILIPVILKQNLQYGFGWNDNTADNATLATIGQPADPYGAAVLSAYKSLSPDQDGSGVGDVETGVMYKFLETEKYEAAAAGGVRLPTGKEDDPNDLKDSPTGDGQYDLGFHFYGDWHFTKLLSVGGWAKYEPQLKATFDKAGGGTLEKDLGDVLKTLVTFYATPLPGLAIKLGVTSKFEGKEKNDGVEVADTNTTIHYLQPKLDYINLKAKIPYRFVFEYNSPLSGKNTLALPTVLVSAQAFLKF